MLVQSKIITPELPSDLVERSALMAKLGVDFSRKLTLVCAPAGFGKTTLVTSWLRLTQARAGEGTPVHVGWYALDEGDNNVHRFYRYLLCAIQQANPDLLADWVDFDYRPQLPSVEEMVNELVDGLWQRSAPILLALDDYHYVSNKEIHQFVNLLLRYLPPHLRLIIATRHDPPLGLAQLRSRGHLHEVRALHLAFSLDETEAFLAGALHTHLDREIVVKVWEQMEGWPAGLRLTALSLQGAEDPQSMVRRFGQQISRHITDYLVEEVISQQSCEVIDFLLSISILNRFNGALCAAVTGMTLAESQSILGYLLHSNLFITALDDYGEWYRFHHLLQEILRNRLCTQYPGDEVTTRQRRAAIWLADHALLDEAVAHFLAAGDQEGAAHTIESSILDLINNERFSTLEQRISLLPSSLVDRRPALLLASAWVRNARYQRDAFPAIIARVEALLREERWQHDDTAALWGQVHALRSSVALKFGDGEEVVANAAATFDLLPESFVWVRSFVLNVLTHFYTLIGNPEEAHRILADERSKVTPVPSFFLVRLSFCDAIVYLFSGTVAEWRRSAFNHMSLSSQLNNPIQMAWAEYGLAIAHLEVGEVDEAVRRLEAIFARPQFAFTITLFLAASHLLPIYALRSKIVEGSSLLSALAQHLRGSVTQASQLEFDALQAYWACLIGDQAAAHRWAEGAELVLPPIESMSPHNLLLARTLFMLGGSSNLERAAAVTNALISYYRKINLTNRLIETLTLHAVICWARRMQQPALTAMREALDLGYPRGYRHTILDQSGSTRQILYELTQERRYAAMAGDLLAQMMAELSKPTTPTHHQADATDGQIEALSERELEILTMVAERLTNKEIAHRLRISPLTVRNHTANIYAKLQVTTRRQAVVRGHQFGILATDPHL
jgi:LuxR family transcriptional regulator, maltose regulon positive regulatory protein